jgi:hypothetical protein
MRLINVYTLAFHEFPVDPPPYAIASHRWVENEATYKDVKKRRNVKSPGYQKVLDFCEFTTRMNERLGSHSSLRCEWLWIDTCCIDKSSSAELQETINSMWAWYSRSTVCYAYLNDLEPLLAGQEIYSSGFARSVWFTRGLDAAGAARSTHSLLPVAGFGDRRT